MLFLVDGLTRYTDFFEALTTDAFFKRLTSILSAGSTSLPSTQKQVLKIITRFATDPELVGLAEVF